MTVDGWELLVRVAGLVVFAVTAAHSLVVALGARDRPVGRSAGLTTGRRRALVVYGLGALPWFLAFVLLWRPLPVEPDEGIRVLLLVVGAGLGVGGAWVYRLGRRELGRMYNVSSSLGTQLFEDHRLVTSGPYAWCRHPMYLGLAMAALGGLAVYRTWSFVFALGALGLTASKALAEERLLAAEFGDRWAEYASSVPRWFPRPGATSRSRKEVRHVRAGTQQE